MNTSQTDWWTKKLASSQRWSQRRAQLYEAGDRAAGDEEWRAVNDMS